MSLKTRIAMMENVISLDDARAIKYLDYTEEERRFFQAVTREIFRLTTGEHDDGNRADPELLKKAWNNVKISPEFKDLNL